LFYDASKLRLNQKADVAKSIFVVVKNEVCLVIEGCLAIAYNVQIVATVSYNTCDNTPNLNFNFGSFATGNAPVALPHLHKA
jgi:hypothetical protein